ncbi:hypothetical protein BV20DRAFT_650492 [Pilatotrama ljubarskyi]|nr:hypothetical protein BV20DRAFT_650492 [Pilatotrama ljubarskyi]
MRLLDTSTGGFVWFDRPEDVSYAILSHVWEKDKAGSPTEQPYHDVLGLWNAAARLRTAQASELAGDEASALTSIVDDPGLSPKIREFCRVAREDGLAYGWADICCIDKTSSAELSEAINSMYAWYRSAEVCYAYLADVPESAATDTLGLAVSSESFEGHPFVCSRWHTRGWTLQELIAPRHVLFLSSSWSLIGTKASLASVLERVTSVDAGLLKHQIALDSISVARKMSWASDRVTTRVEDEAYSLMGIFGVHIPTIYGEGLHAFRRLQEEIIRTVPDQSIFAWGYPEVFAYPPSHPEAFDHDDLGNHVGLWRNESCGESWGVLAPSPRYFGGVGDIVASSDEDFVRHLPASWRPHRTPDIHCLFTPQGIRIELLCVELPGARLSQSTPPRNIIPYSGNPTSRRTSCSCDSSATTEYLGFLRCLDGERRPIALLLSCTVDVEQQTNVQRSTAPVQMCASHRFYRTAVVSGAQDDVSSGSAASTAGPPARIITVNIRPMIGTHVLLDLHHERWDYRTARRRTPAWKEDWFECGEARLRPWCRRALERNFTVAAQCFKSHAIGDRRKFQVTLYSDDASRADLNLRIVMYVYLISRDPSFSKPWGAVTVDRLQHTERTDIYNDSSMVSESTGTEFHRLCSLPIDDLGLLERGVDVRFPSAASPLEVDLRLSGQMGKATDGRSGQWQVEDEVLWLALEVFDR